MLTRQQYTARVVANIPICRDHYRLVLELKSFPQTEPGQFVQVACRSMDQNYGDQREIDWSPGAALRLTGQETIAPLAMLRRPFSLAGRRETSAGVELEIIHRVVGIGTGWLADFRAS